MNRTSMNCTSMNRTSMNCTSPIYSPLRIIDLSSLNRFGVKGAGAANWLTEQGIALPERPNSWLPLSQGGSQGGLVARLGLSEFLIEDDGTGQTAWNLNQQLNQSQSFPAKVYPVLRQDFAIALWGDAVYDLLAQTCSINVRALVQAEQPVVITSMIGVAVTLIPDERASQPFYRLWCDRTFSDYVRRTLLDIITELDGGIADSDSLIDSDP